MTPFNVVYNVITLSVSTYIKCKSSSYYCQRFFASFHLFHYVIYSKLLQFVDSSSLSQDRRIFEPSKLLIIPNPLSPHVTIFFAIFTHFIWWIFTFCIVCYFIHNYLCKLLHVGLIRLFFNFKIAFLWLICTQNLSSFQYGVLKLLQIK